MANLVTGIDHLPSTRLDCAPWRRARDATGLDGLVTESGARTPTTECVHARARGADEPRGRERPRRRRLGRGAIAAAIDAIVERLRGGGRLIYVGAGSSGRIAALDADECEATFSTEPGQVVALVAGGGLPRAAQRGRRGRRDAGAGAVEALGVSDRDAVVGISASGRTPYVLGALEAAARRGSGDRLRRLRARLASSPALAEHELAVVVGPEFVAGSTRLKAGTAQKLVLNTISTVAMIRLGKTFDDLMVDVRASNEKLAARARRIVALATGASAGRGRPGARGGGRQREGRDRLAPRGLDADARAPGSSARAATSIGARA